MLYLANVDAMSGKRLCYVWQTLMLCLSNVDAMSGKSYNTVSRKMLVTRNDTSL